LIDNTSGNIDITEQNRTEESIHAHTHAHTHVRKHTYYRHNVILYEPLQETSYFILFYLIFL